MKKKSMRFSALLLCIVMMGGSMIGCSKEVSVDKNSETKKIAYITPGLDDPFWRHMANGIENKVIDLGLDAIVQIYDSNNSSKTQLQNAQDAIVQGTDVIIISPTDSSSCPAVLAAAEEANIPVIIADIGTDSGTYDGFVITPNKEGVLELGDYLANYLEENNITGITAAQITVSLARNNGKARFDGFNEALEQMGIELEDYCQLEDYTRAEAESFTQDLMIAYQDLGLIFCHAGEPTLGVVKAVQNADKSDDIIVVGFDATEESIDAIKDGSILAIAVQQPALMGAYAVEAVEKIFNGEKPEAQIDVPTLLVTQENVNDQDIQDKLAVDVFPNVKSK
jgi:ABC-type sugar transport system substrate-binding protein